MITLITGVPGGGKTLYTVHEILQPESKAGRQLFVDGIPELVIPHEVAPDLLEWPDWAPHGAHIIVDEAQRIWRPEASGKTPHRSIAEFETHRHRGLDFTIITQHPNLIHANIRRLVGRHIHLRRTAFGVIAYEWSECKTSPDTAWKSAVTKLRWKHPKSSFGLYKSASIHQQVKFRIPKAVWFIAIPVLLSPLLIWGLYKVFTQGFAPPVPNASTAKAAPPPSSPFSMTPAPAQPVAEQQGAPVAVASTPKPEKEVDIRESFIPRVYGEPNTAPAYDHLRTVVVMPVVAACIADADRCMCYTQQMTKVDMPEAQCRERVARGEFDPYRDVAKPREVRGELPNTTPHTET
ncbi:zonular occludens toxin domain-containing protein [Aeromonas veronii]